LQKDRSPPSSDTVHVIVAASDSTLRDALLEELRASGHVVDEILDSTVELRRRLDRIDSRAAVALIVTGYPPVAPSPASAPQSPPAGSLPNSARLTDREREVLEWVAAGVSNKGIARRLGVSPNTVKYHITALLAKLRASTRAEAVAAAARRGEISL
jgi:DNA-binding CsgD family transcriptional regulator